MTLLRWVFAELDEEKHALHRMPKRMVNSARGTRGADGWDSPAGKNTFPASLKQILRRLDFRIAQDEGLAIVKAAHGGFAVAA